MSDQGIQIPQYIPDTSQQQAAPQAPAQQLPPQAPPQAPPQQQPQPQQQQQQQPQYAPQAPPQQQQQVQLSQYAQSLLQAVPDTERAVVQKHMANWDASIQRQVMDLQRQYAAYDPLLDTGLAPEDLQLAVQLLGLAQSDYSGAHQLIDMLASQMGGQQPAPQYGQGVSPQQYMSQQAQQQYGQPPVGGQYGAGQYGAPQYGQQGYQQPQMQIPPQLMQTLGQMNQFMQQTAVRNQEQDEMLRQAGEDQALVDYFSFLHQEKGDFDEDFVGNYMLANDVSGDQAVDAFNQMRAQWSGGQGGVPTIPVAQNPQMPGQPVNGNMPAPPVLNGGSAPVGTKPISKATSQERVQLVQQMLTAANQQQ